MSTSTHDVALFEEGFALVRVDETDVHTYSAHTLYEIIQGHPWVLENELPVVIVYETTRGMEAYGDDNLVEAVKSMDYEEIVWGHELTLEWEDAEEEEWAEEEEEAEEEE